MVNLEDIKKKRFWAFALFILVAAVSLFCLSDLVRKNDQVAILSGAIDLSRDRLQEWGNYYQYDKCYVVYWLLGGVFKMIPQVDPIALGNGFGCVLFFGAFGFWLKNQKQISTVALLGFLTAPALLFNTIYVNSSAFASAFLFIGLALFQKRSVLTNILAAVSLFGATGSRVDIVLIVPFLIWSIMPASFFGAKIFRWWRWIVLAIGPFFGLVLGFILRETKTPLLDPFFNSKMVLGYAVFGFGALALLYLVSALKVFTVSFKRKKIIQKLFYALGAVAILLPAVFYVGQLHTPRYFLRAAEIALLFCFSRRGQLLLNRLIFRRTIFSVTAIGCIIPIFVGINLGELNRPRLTVENVTYFPSGDGYYPMGSYAYFLGRLKTANENPIDHNQLVWKAVSNADLDFSKPVPVLWTPMFGYFMLRASLENGVAECLPFSDLEGVEFYSETRTWMRIDPKFAQNEISALLDLPSKPVSESFFGVEVREFGVGDMKWSEQNRELAEFFGGSEYRIIPSHLFGDEKLHNLQKIGDITAVFALPKWMSIQQFKK